MDAASEPKRADLVLEGGGVKGIALVGALAVLEDAGFVFSRVAGTSAGAAVGSLVAARIPVYEVAEIMHGADFSRFQDKCLLQRLDGTLGRGLSLILENGMYEGHHFVQYLRGHLANASVRTFADLQCDPDPGDHLRADRAYRLVVMASDLSLHCPVRLPWDFNDRYFLPGGEQDVALAVQASMSIPFIFEPYRLHWQLTDPDGSVHRVTSVLADGGMLSNFPVETFDRPPGEEPRWPTFGVKLSARETDRARFLPHRGGPIDRLVDMLGSMSSYRDAMHIDRAETRSRTIFVDTFGIPSTALDLDDATRRRLYDSGRGAAEKFLSTWDFKRYKREFRAGDRSRRRPRGDSLDGARPSPARDRAMASPVS